MKSYTFISIILLAAVVSSCEKDTIYLTGLAGDIVGHWIEPEYNDTLITYKRAIALIDNEPGISFSSNATLTERKNSGWCGTPPISYSDFSGTWVENDSILDITVGFWGGSIIMEWEIGSISETELTFYIRNQETLFEED